MKRRIFNLVILLLACLPITSLTSGSDLGVNGLVGMEGSLWQKVGDNRYSIGFYRGMVLHCIDGSYCAEDHEGFYVNSPVIGYFSKPSWNMIGFTICPIGIGWAVSPQQPTDSMLNGPLIKTESFWSPWYIE